MKISVTSMQQGEKRFQNLEVDADRSGTYRESRLVSVFPDRTYQTIHGFGGAFTDSAGYVYSLMSPEDREEFLRACFGWDGLGYTWGRTSIDSCDFSLETYCADNDPADTDFRHMDYSRGEKYVLPLLRDAEKAAGRPIRLMLTQHK